MLSEQQHASHNPRFCVSFPPIPARPAPALQLDRAHTSSAIPLMNSACPLRTAPCLRAQAPVAPCVYSPGATPNAITTAASSVAPRCPARSVAAARGRGGGTAANYRLQPLRQRSVLRQFQSYFRVSSNRTFSAARPKLSPGSASFSLCSQTRSRVRSASFKNGRR